MISVPFGFAFFLILTKLKDLGYVQATKPGSLLGSARAWRFPPSAGRSLRLAVISVKGQRKLTARLPSKTPVTLSFRDSVSPLYILKRDFQKVGQSPDSQG